MNRRKTIGFDRRLAFDWLEATASRVAAGDSLEELRAGMWAYLEGKVSGDKFNSDRAVQPCPRSVRGAGIHSTP